MSEQASGEAAPQQAPPTAAEIAAAVASAMPAPQAAPEPEQRMNEKELAEYMQVYQPDQSYADALQAAIIGEDSTPEMRIEAIEAMRDGIVGQAIRGAELLIEEKIGSVEQKFGASTAYAQQAQAEAMWNDFATAYPQLKEHKELVDMVSTNLLSSGFKPTSKDDLYSKVSEGAAGMIQKFDNNFSLGKGAQAPTQTMPPAQMPEMAGASGAPQGGPGNPAVKADDVSSVWD